MKFVRKEGSKKISIAVLNKEINKYGCWCINTEDFDGETEFSLLVTAIFEEFAQKNNIDEKYTGFNLAEIAFTTDISENKCCEYTTIIKNIWGKIKANKGELELL